MPIPLVGSRTTNVRVSIFGVVLSIVALAAFESIFTTSGPSNTALSADSGTRKTFWARIGNGAIYINMGASILVFCGSAASDDSEPPRNPCCWILMIWLWGAGTLYTAAFLFWSAHLSAIADPDNELWRPTMKLVIACLSLIVMGNIFGMISIFFYNRSAGGP